MICTVAISTFNSAGYLRTLLGQLARQTLVSGIEVVVIDSGSNQDEHAVCVDFEEAFPSLRYVRTPRETLYAAWNRALSMARGEFFVNANTDDSMRPDSLEKFARCLAENPQVSLAYCDWLWTETPNLETPWPVSARVCRHAAYEPWMPLFYAYAGCHQFWRTEKLKELGGFDARYRCAGDYEILCRLAEQGGQAIHLPEALSAFYQNPSGLSRSSGHSREEFYQIRDRFRSKIGIGHLADVNESDREACAAAWTYIARQALDLYVPWATHPTPDLDYARHCLALALQLDPRNQEAHQLHEKIFSLDGQTHAHAR